MDVRFSSHCARREGVSRSRLRIGETDWLPVDDTDGGGSMGRTFVFFSSRRLDASSLLMRRLRSFLLGGGSVSGMMMPSGEVVGPL